MEQSCVGHKIENAVARPGGGFYAAAPMPGAGRLRCQAGSRYIITRQPAVVQVPCPSSAGDVQVLVQVQVPPPEENPQYFLLLVVLLLKRGAPRFQAAPPAWAHVDNNKAASSCPSSLSKFGGGTWTSGFARGKHVIKFVRVPCPSSCPSSGSPNKLGQVLQRSLQKNQGGIEPFFKLRKLRLCQLDYGLRWC